MMDAEEEDKEVLAAEYVLGTLGPDERAQAQALSVLDAGFAAGAMGFNVRRNLPPLPGQRSGVSANA